MSVHQLDNAHDSCAKVQRAHSPLNADAWGVVLGHLTPGDVPRMALTCRALHAATVAECYLFDLFVRAQNKDDAIHACMLACAATSLATLDRMLAVPRTRMLEPADMPWFWSAVLRRLVCRQPRERVGSRLALHPALPRWQELIDRLEPRAVVAPCMFLSASLTGNVAILRAYARAYENEAQAEILLLGIRLGGVAVAQALEDTGDEATIHCYTPAHTTLPLDGAFSAASLAAWSYRDATIDRFLPLWRENGILELLCVAMALGDMTLVRACCGHLIGHGDLDENDADVLLATMCFGHGEAVQYVMSSLADEQIYKEGQVIFNNALRNGHHELAKHIVDQATSNRLSLDLAEALPHAIRSRNPMCVRVVCQGSALATVPIYRLFDNYIVGGIRVSAPVLDELDQWGMLPLDNVKSDASLVAWLFRSLDDDQLIARVIDRYHIAGPMLSRITLSCSLRVAVRLAAQEPLDVGLANFTLSHIVCHVGASGTFPAGVPLRSLVSLCDQPHLTVSVAARAGL